MLFACIITGRRPTYQKVRRRCPTYQKVHLMLTSMDIFGRRPPIQEARRGAQLTRRLTPHATSMH